MNILDELVAVRKTQGVTQSALAVRAGLSRITINKLENGVVDPQLSTLVEYGRALDVELMVVPSHLRAELESFIRSGGRLLAQPTGAGGPPSVVDQVLGGS